MTICGLRWALEPSPLGQNGYGSGGMGVRGYEGYEGTGVRGVRGYGGARGTRVRGCEGTGIRGYAAGLDPLVDSESTKYCTCHTKKRKKQR